MSNPLLPSNTHTHVAADIPDFQTSVSNVPAVALMTVHRGLTDNPHITTADDLVPPLGNVPDVKQNLTATSPPTTADNQTDDYTVGSRWIDTSSNTEYVCTFSNMSTATWVVAHGAAQSQISGLANEQLAIDINGTTLTLNTDNYIAASNASPIVFNASTTASAVIASGGAGTNLQFTDATYAAVVSTTGPVTISGQNAVVGACRNAAVAPIAISGSGRARAILGCVGPQTLGGTGDNNGIMFSDSSDVTTGHEISGTATDSLVMGSTGGKITITSGDGCFSIGSTTATTISGTRVGQLASAGGGTLSGSNSMSVASLGAVTFANNGAGRFVLGCSATVNVTAGSQNGAMFCSGNVTVSHTNAAVFCCNSLSTTADNQFKCNEFRTVTGGMISDPRQKKWLIDVPDDPDFASKFAAIQPIQYRYLTDDPAEPLRVGFSAQDVQASFPHVVQDTFLRKIRCTKDEETNEWMCDGQVYNANFVTLDDEQDPTRGTYRRELAKGAKSIAPLGLVQLIWTACQKNSAAIRSLREQLITLQNA